MVPSLDPKPIQVHNVRFWTRRITDAGVSASVNQILEGFAERGNEESDEKGGTVARTWHMDNPGMKFKELLKNKQYFDELFDLLRSNHGQGYFVTDIVTFVNLEVTKQSSKIRAGGASAQVPVDPSTGINVGASARLQVVRENGYSATYEDETIVFLGYRLVRLEKVDGKRAKLGRVLFGQKHGYEINNGNDYWPEMVEKPVEGNANPYLGPQDDAENVKDVKAEEEEEKCRIIVKELGYDYEVVG